MRCLTTPLFIILVLACSLSARAQITGQVSSPYQSIEQNTVSNMEGLGDTLWIGPGLNRTIGGPGNWYLPQGADSVANGRGRVFSLALAPDTVITGLGFSENTSNGTVQTGMGYYLSTDGGDAWQFIELPLDSEDDTTVVYGGETYAILPITVPQQSPPFDVAQENGTILTANWASGIVRSTDFGTSWQRLLLPPQRSTDLVPEKSYTFESNEGNRYDPRADQNLLGFAVIIDDQDRAWAGSAGGVNISPNALTAPRDSIRWNHIQVEEAEEGLLGNWVISIRQQPATGDIWMTNWPAGIQPFEDYGIVRTPDGGQTFDRYLVGERINDIDFKGDTVYAAGTNGLFISNDNGQSWSRIEQIQSPTTYIKEGAEYLSLAATTERIWVGTDDGIAVSGDRGANWSIIRVNFPLKGGNQYQPNAPDVNTFAYPNPFSPRRHSVTRIKFEIQQQGHVKIRLFDYGMNLIRVLEDGSFAAGTYEAVWDGTDRNGRQVANGPVFYQVDTPSGTIRGKILVID